jgi:hypothetical protein
MTDQKPKRITAAEAFAAHFWPVGTVLMSADWRRPRRLVDWDRAPGGPIVGVVLAEVKPYRQVANRSILKSLPGDVHALRFTV